MCCDNDRTDPIEKGAFGGGCASKSLDMRAGVSSRVSTCRRLPKVLRCNVYAVITTGQTPLKRVRLGVGVSPRVLTCCAS